MEFTGFEYCVKIDETRCHEPLVIKAGNVVDILKTNTQHSHLKRLSEVFKVCL